MESGIWGERREAGNWGQGEGRGRGHREPEGLEVGGEVGKSGPVLLGSEPLRGTGVCGWEFVGLR